MLAMLEDPVDTVLPTTCWVVGTSHYPGKVARTPKSRLVKGTKAIEPISGQVARADEPVGVQGRMSSPSRSPKRDEYLD